MMISLGTLTTLLVVSFGPTPRTPEQFEADVTIKTQIPGMPFPIPPMSGHMYYDFMNERQRVDTSMFGMTQSNVDFYSMNKSIAYATFFGQTTCSTCYLKPPMYPLIVVPNSLSRGTITVNGEQCEMWENPMLTAVGILLDVCVSSTDPNPHIIFANITVGVGPLYPPFMRTTFSYYLKNTKLRQYQIDDPVFAIPSVCPQQATCAARMNVVFLLDGSGSIQSSDWTKDLQFVNSMLDRFTMSKDAVMAGVVQFSSSTQTSCSFGADKSTLQGCVSKISQMKTGTNTAAGINAAASMLQSGPSADHNLIILITDGKSNEGSDPATAARNAESSAKAEVYGIGVGSDIDAAQLKSIVTQPASTHYFTVSNYDELNKIMDKVAANSCDTTTCNIPSNTLAKLSQE
eukprot:m.10768 g.10768  ORF g.10768 m.10768 type:complete len:403 (+) comp4316_c0_seq1:85-1293(+)